MSLQTRINALETRLLGRSLPPLPPARFARPDGSEHGKVFACMSPRQPEKPSGMTEFFTKTVWLDRRSCQYADACPFADKCTADGSNPGATKMSA